MPKPHASEPVIDLSANTTAHLISSRVRINRAKVSASKSRLTSIRRPSVNTTFQRAGSRSAALALDPSHLHLNQLLIFALSVDFHPAPFEPSLQCTQRQMMLMTKCAPPQSTGFEFPHQSFALFAARRFPTPTSPISVMPTLHQKHAPSARWVALTDRIEWMSVEDLYR